jgi:hypothetical protein
MTEWILILSLYASGMNGSGVGLTHVDGFASYEACSLAGEQYDESTRNGYYRCISVVRELK